MLKLCCQESLPDVIAPLESRLRGVLEQLGLRHLNPQFCGWRTAVPDALRLWYKFSETEALWGLYFERDGERMSRRGLYLLVGNGSLARQYPTLCSHSEHRLPTNEAIFELWTDEGEERGILALSAIADPVLQALEISFPKRVRPGRLATSVKIHIKIEQPLSKLLLVPRFLIPWGCSVDLRDSEHHWRSELLPLVTQDGGVVPYEGASSASNLYFFLKEKNMTEQHLSAAPYASLSLEIGSLEIPLQDLLRVRVGHALACTMPEGAPGTLRMDGRILASVSIRLEKEGLSVEITELFSRELTTKLLAGSSDKDESTFSGESHELTPVAFNSWSPS